MKAFLIRKPSGLPHPVIGVDVELPFLPDYKFFAWKDNCECFRVTEASTGGLVLAGEPGDPLEAVRLAANAKLKKLGRANAIAPIAKLLTEYRPLNERNQ